MNFLPGEPNSTSQASCFVKWGSCSVFAYCSGNNLIILTKLLTNLQTLYFDQDLSCVDINPANGLIAISTAATVQVYKPVKTSSQNKSVYWTWQFSNEIIADHSNVNSLSWGNDSELVIGTDKQLTLVNIHRQDEYSNYNLLFIWCQPLPNPCYLVKFSRNSELIACISKYDKFIKFFYRTNFDIANTQFNLLYLKHSSYVTDFKFRFIDHSHQLESSQGSRYNILYTISNDNYIRVFLSFEFQKSKKVQHWGSLKLTDSSLANGISERKFIKIIDNYFFDYMINRSLERFQKHGILNDSLNANLQNLSKLQSDLIMVANMQGNLSFYLVTNLNSNPPKSIFFKKLSFSSNGVDDDGGDGESTSQTSSITSLTSSAKASSEIIQFPQNVFPSDPRFVIFSDSIKISAKKARPKHGKVTFANFHEFNSQDDEVSKNGDIAFIIHNLVKKNLRFVYLKLDDFLQNLNYNELYNNYDELYVNNLNRSITNLSIKHSNASNPKTSTIATKTIPSSISGQQPTFTTLNAVLGNKITGHNKSIQKLFKDLSGEACLSISRFNEHKLWIPLKLSGKITKHSSLARMTLQRKSVITTNSSIISAVLLRRGDTIITYSAQHELIVWTTHGLEAKQIAASKAISDGDDDKMRLLTFFHLPEYHHDYKYDMHYVIGIYKSSTPATTLKYVTKAWEVNLQNNSIASITIDNLIPEVESKTETKTEANNSNFDIQCISPVDPVGWNISLDNYSRDILTVISSSGILKSYSVKLHKKGSSNSPPKITWINNCTIDTNIINASHIKGSSINKIAIANETKTKVYIYNTSYSILEFSQDFTNLKKEGKEDEISDLDWANITEKTFTSENNSRNTPCVLSIGFKHAVLLYTQLNFDYTNNLPAFAPIKKIDLLPFTSHVINDSMWLNNGLLCIGTGNQLFVSDNYSKNSLTPQMIAQDNYTKKIIGDRSLNNNSIDSIFSLVEILNNTLPVYHPQIIIQCMYFGKINLVKKIFLKLFLYLRKVEPEDNSFNDYDDDDDDDDDDAMTEDENGSILTNGVKRKEKKFQLKYLPRLLGFSVEDFYYRYSLSKQKRKLLSSSSRNSSASAMALFLSNDSNDKKFNNSHKHNTRMTITDEQLYTTKNFKSWVKLLKEKLMAISLPILTRHQQITLLTIIESLEILDKYRALTSFQESVHAIRNSNTDDGDDDDDDDYDYDENNEKSADLDFNGFNFLLGYKLYQSHIRTQAGLNMRDNLFGIHCKNKQVLLDIINGNISIHDESLSNGPSPVSHNHNSKLTWVKCKRTGMVYWLTDQLLVQQFETIANNEFQNSVKNENLTYQQQLQRLNNGAMILDSPVNEDLPYFETSRTRNPINATLFYLALKKKSILIKLWRICHGHPEQAKLIKFLSLDFENSEKNRISAVKNAFALLSKHRYYMASCFFLLADSLQDCVNVLIKKCNDVELAIAVARVYEFVNIKIKTNQTIDGDFSSHANSFNISSLDSYYSQVDSFTATQKLKKRNFKGPIFTSILIDHLLPMALNDGNRWICTYIFWSLHEDKLALVALIKSPYEVLKENICNVTDGNKNVDADSDSNIESNVGKISEIGKMAKGAANVNGDGAGDTDSFSYLDDVTARSKFIRVLKAYEKEKNITMQLQQQKSSQSGKMQQQQQQQNQLVAREKEIIVSNNNIFLKTDPILVIIYKELRNDMARSGFFRNSSRSNDSYHTSDNPTRYNKILSVFSHHEFQFIHRISLIYSRMGCDYLSIDLLRNWKFVDCLGIAKESAAEAANAAKDQVMFPLQEQQKYKKRKDQKQQQVEKDKKNAAATTQRAVAHDTRSDYVDNDSINSGFDNGFGNGNGNTRLKPVSNSAFQEFNFDDFGVGGDGGFGGGANIGKNNISSSISQVQSKHWESEQKNEGKNEGKPNDTEQYVHDVQDIQGAHKTSKTINQFNGLESKKSKNSDEAEVTAGENGDVDELKENDNDESSNSKDGINNPFKNKAPPPKVAFEEPDLSAFDFGM